ncbi:BON domain-containing protein [Azotobacter salinestris]|uniref:BON domain-containing protein n=1 Tax=Azotobacter salinestris TaxID=69964 RepID=UPI0032DFBA6E
MKTPLSNHAPQRLGAAVRDAWLTAGVKSSLALARETRGQDIHVKTRAGEVFLSGLVDDYQRRNRALQLAGAVHGVIRVDSRDLAVRLMPEPPGAEESADYRAYEAQRRRTEDRH